MGNCMRCGKKKNESAEFGSGRKPKKGKNKGDNKQNGFEQRGTTIEKNGKAGGDHANGNIEEPFKVVKLTPLEELQSKDGADGAAPRERKKIRLILPYIPKKEWGKLRLVCKTWCSVVDGEWARMHSLHLPELLPNPDDGNAAEKRGRLADHIGSNCQLSRSILCSPPPKSHSAVVADGGHLRGHIDRASGPVDLSEKQFWNGLLPRTEDLTTLRLRQVRLPKYFFTEFLPLCKKLEVLEIQEAPAGIGKDGRGEEESWTDADGEKLRSAIASMDKLKYQHLALIGSRLSPVIENYRGSSSVSPTQRHRGDHSSRYIDQSIQADAKRFGKSSPREGVSPPIPHTSSSVYDCGPLTASSLATLIGKGDSLTRLSLDLNLQHLREFDRDPRNIQRAFSALKQLRELRITITTSDDDNDPKNVYATLQTLAIILATVADHARGLTSLKLIRLPDPMGIDKQLATEFTTALVKLNDETELESFEVCVLAPQEMFHAWCLPWPALTRLRRLTLTDCNLYPQRHRVVDLESMPLLTALTLHTDSLNDDMVTRVFAKPHPAISELSLAPGPKGIGKRGMKTIAAACYNLKHLTIYYTRVNKANKEYSGGGDVYDDGNAMDSEGWELFFRLTENTLESVTLIDVERRYMNEAVAPVASAYRHVNVKPVYENILRSSGRRLP